MSCISEISYDELHNGLKDFIIVDVRKPEELLETGIIPGSFNLPCKYIYIDTLLRLLASIERDPPSKGFSNNNNFSRNPTETVKLQPIKNENARL